MTDFQKRQILNSILESKLYRTNGSPEGCKEHSLSLTDINACGAYNIDQRCKLEEYECEGVDHCDDLQDTYDDDQLLQSLEKRFKQIDQGESKDKRHKLEKESIKECRVIDTDQSPSQFENKEEMVDG